MATMTLTTPDDAVHSGPPSGRLTTPQIWGIVLLAPYALVFLAFVLALALNFLGIAGYQCWLDGVSIRRKAEESLMPITRNTSVLTAARAKTGS